MASGHIESLLDNIDVAADTYVFNVYAAIAGEIAPTLRLLFILFLIFYGLAMMQGWIQTSIQDFTKNIFRICVIFIFATMWTWFNELVYPFFTDSPAYLGQILLAADPNSIFYASSINETLGSIYDQGMYVAGFLMYEHGGITNLSMVFTGLLVGVVTLLMVGYATFLIAMAKVAIAVLLGFAPVMIAFMVFSATRGIFEGWLRQVINFALIPLLTYGILIFVISMASPFVNQLAIQAQSGMTGSIEVFPFVLCCIVGFLLLLQTMGIASGIAGGMQLSTMNAIGSTLRSAAMSSWGRMHVKLPSFKGGASNTISNR